MNMLCPLCNKTCTVSKMADEWALITCPTKAKLILENTLSHFAVYTTSTFGNVFHTVHSATIPPYRLENHMLSKNSFSKILAMNGRTYIDYDGYEMYEFEEVLKVDDLIHMDSEDKLLERIKLLVLLS